MNLRFSGIVGFSTVVALLDQLTKYIAVRELRLGESIAVTPFFSFTLVYNTGSAFGLFQGNNKALLILASVILVWLIYSARGLCERAGLWGAFGVALAIGGAVGNIVDRVRFGQVVDFLDFHFWPVFNLADSAISLGAVALLIGLWNDRR